MKPITSLADYFQKVKENKNYKKVAIRCYNSYCGYRIKSYKKAIEWIDKWTKDNVGDGKYNDTCSGMVDYLNQNMRQIQNWENL